MNRIAVKDICWLTGMLEGEGSFSLQQQSSGLYPRIEIKSIDHEVVERLLNVTGAGTIQTDKRSLNPNHKQCYTWRVTSASDVLHILCSAVSFGFFSEHRTKQILDAVDACSSILNRKWDVKFCVQCQKAIPSGHHFNRKYCEPKCKWANERWR